MTHWNLGVQLGRSLCRRTMLIAALLLLLASGCGPGKTAVKADYQGHGWTDTGRKVSKFRTESLAFNPNSGILYAGFSERVRMPGQTEGRGMWMYDGKNWTDTGGAVSDYVVKSIVCDAKNNTVYAGCSKWTVGGEAGHELMGAGIWKYAEGKWTSAGIPSDLYVKAGPLAFDPDREILYASSQDEEAYALVTMCANNHWSIIGKLENSWVGCMATGSNGDVYAGVPGCLIRYDGSEWVKCSPENIKGVECLSYDAAEQLLYVGTFESQYKGQGVWKYDGSNWTDTGGPIAGYPVNSLVAESPTKVFASFYENISGRGVWKYDGSAWINISDRHQDDYFGELAFDSKNNVLYTGLYSNDQLEGKGVWKYKVD